MNNLVNKKAFYVSNILDNTNENKVATYKLVTDFADDYHFSCKESSSITLYDENEKIINSCNNEMTLSLKKKVFIM